MSSEFSQSWSYVKLPQKHKETLGAYVSNRVPMETGKPGKSKWSWNTKNWQKFMEFCHQSWNFTNFGPELYQICMFFATAKKLSMDVESPHFPTLSTKHC